MPRVRQWIWFVVLWAGGVGMTGLIAWTIRFWLTPGS